LIGGAAAVALLIGSASLFDIKQKIIGFD